MQKELVVVQQYLSWKGHYRQYFENLLDSKYNYLYASHKPEDYPNAKWIKSDFNTEQALTIKSKIKGRFLDSYNVFKQLGSDGSDVIHLIEFEPLTYLLFSSRFKKGHRLIITMHSSDRLHYSSWLNNKISGLQRWLLEKALRKAVISGAFIVTHYECHKESIKAIIGGLFTDRVSVIHYPAPSPDSAVAKTYSNLNSPKYLIYGQIREDKGIYEFLQNDSTKNLNITIAGKIVDRRILEFTRSNLKVIDKFLSEEDINSLVHTHDFMLLPYPIEYTNGAGTFKDSLAKAMPVVCSNIPIFHEIVNSYNVGLIFDNIEDIERQVSRISVEEYTKLSQNCLIYANTFNWEYMRNAYFSLYNKLLNSI